MHPTSLDAPVTRHGLSLAPSLLDRTCQELSFPGSSAAFAASWPWPSFAEPRRTYATTLPSFTQALIPACRSSGGIPQGVTPSFDTSDIQFAGLCSPTPCRPYGTELFARSKHLLRSRHGPQRVVGVRDEVTHLVMWQLVGRVKVQRQQVDIRLVLP